MQQGADRNGWGSNWYHLFQLFLMDFFECSYLNGRILNWGFLLHLWQLPNLFDYVIHHVPCSIHQRLPIFLVRYLDHPWILPIPQKLHNVWLQINPCRKFESLPIQHHPWSQMLELHLFVNEEKHVSIVFFNGKSKEGSIVLVLPRNLSVTGVV